MSEIISVYFFRRRCVVITRRDWGLRETDGRDPKTLLDDDWMVFSVHEFVFKIGWMVTEPMAVEGIASVGGGLSRGSALPRNRPFSLLQVVFS